MRKKPYIQLSDIKTICSWIEQVDSDDEFLTFRINARNWLDSAVAVRCNLVPDYDFHCEIDHRLVRACAYRAAYEILASQITPQTEENAFERMAAKFQRMAENEISTLKVRVHLSNSVSMTVDLGTVHRGRYA